MNSINFVKNQKQKVYQTIFKKIILNILYLPKSGNEQSQKLWPFLLQLSKWVNLWFLS